jgi:DNA recombination protein RmuC
MVPVLVIAALVMQIVILFRKTALDVTPLKDRFEAIEKTYERIENAVKTQISDFRGDLSREMKQSRDELAWSVKSFGEAFRNQLESFRESSERKTGELHAAVENKLKEIQTGNEARLEEMRKTVDEKLQGTLEKRLGESFKLVSDRLELVHKGLGEMQTLAAGVGDLKKALTNVKVRGTWGEAQLGSLLEEYFTPEQYDKNVAVKRGSLNRVEFAIRLPGKDTDSDQPVYLPIDSKFPQEDYTGLLNAQEQGSLELVEQYSRALEARIKSEARDIRDKYINPPATTDFAVMFLPTESLYAEVLRRPGLGESITRDYRVIITGPTTCAALLCSLQVGFRTLVVEKRSAEIWKLLGAVKSEFGKFGDILDKTHKKMLETSNVIESAVKKSRGIERKLTKVQELPANEAVKMLESEDDTDGPEGEDE